MTKNFNDDDFLAYSKEHVFHEVQMLFYTRTLLLNNSWDESRKLLKNAIIESFVIHLRNLITFLYPTKNPWDMDVYAKDFFSDPNKWEEVIPKSLEKARERANKEVGHLTTERIIGAPPEKDWLVAELTEEILPILKSFCDRADKGKLDMVVSNLLK